MKLWADGKGENVSQVDHVNESIQVAVSGNRNGDLP